MFVLSNLDHVISKQQHSFYVILIGYQHSTHVILNKLCCFQPINVRLTLLWMNHVIFNQSMVDSRYFQPINDLIILTSIYSGTCILLSVPSKASSSNSNKPWRETSNRHSVAFISVPPDSFSNREKTSISSL